MRIRYTAALAALLLGSSALQAQGRLTGVVRDSLGLPIIAAEIWVQGVAGLVTTNRRGAFEVPDIKPGTATVTVRRLAYAPQTMILKITAGDNTLPDIVLTAAPRQLDTVMTREQLILRERPLLREMEENRKIGLGQFVTRTELARNQGGFISQHFNQMRGIVVVRRADGKNGMWLGNKYLPNVGNCSVLEDGERGGLIPPTLNGANCDYCFPTVYLDYTRLSNGNRVPNIAQFNPDQLEAIEVYAGAAETPMRYSSGFSSCGAIVLHTRHPDFKTRVIAAKQDHPTRSRMFASGSISAGAACLECSRGSAADIAVGYTLRDRWVMVGRYAKWSNVDGGAQTMKLRQALVEWYPHRDPGRVKWFINAGLGLMSIDINTLTEGATRDHFDTKDNFSSGRLPSTVVGTGVDVSTVGRFVLTPFFSFTRTFLGDSRHTRCVNVRLDDGSYEWQCFGPITEPGTFNLKQLGIRIGWR